MSLQFILGRLHTNKKAHIYSQLVEWSREDSDNQVFYLVPDHIKFESEMNILEYIKASQSDTEKHDHYAGMINLQVFSFSRLAWYYLQDTAVFSHSQLTETGLSMLIRKILKENEEDLTIFRGESHQQGFVDKTTTLFMEMRNGRVHPEDLGELFIDQWSDEAVNSDLKLKLTDIKRLYEAFMDQLIGKYIEKEDMLEALIQEVKERDLSQTQIIIEHFNSFSAQEQALILELVEQAQDVKVSLILDKKHAVEPPDLTDFFYETGMTYYRLYQQARERDLQIQYDVVLDEASSEHCSELNKLEKYWVDSFDLSPEKPLPKDFSMEECIEIRAAENKQAEVLHAATTIKKLVATDNYRYKDILVVSRVLDDYKWMLEATFAENEIELFVDQADHMSGHALVEAIQSLFLIHKRYWRYDDIMRFLKTELFIPLIENEQLPKDNLEKLAFWNDKAEDWRTRLDILENVMLAYGYEGREWVEDKEWIYARFHLEEMDEQLDADKQMQRQANEAKDQVRKILLPFYQKLSKLETNREAARLLYQFLDEQGFNDQLLYWRDQAIEQGELEEARKHEQVWQTFIQLLDEFVDVLGDEPWDLDTFLSILETGFEQATYSIVPPSIDQVMFTTFDKSRINTKKVVIILGMTDTQLPMSQENDSILTDEDREALSAYLPDDKYLAPTTSGRLASEPFAAYTAFMNASERLIFSYPVKNDGSGDNQLSPYIERISRQLSVPVKQIKAEPGNLRQEPPETLLSFVGSRRETMGHLVNVLREGIDKEHQPSLFWMKLYQSLFKDAHPIERKILSSLEYSNIPKRLDRGLAEELYGKDLYLSVSQLESFYLDPYSHFLRYGLKLKERTVQELTPAETGTFFHDALDSVFKTIVNRNLNVSDLNDKKLNELTDEVLQELYEKNKFRLLSMSNRMKFIRRQLSDTIRQMMWAISNQSRRSRMTPQQSEVLFGRIAAKQGVPGLSFPLNNGGKLHVRGKIDRLDTLEIDDQLYISVVDYKSGAKKLEFDEIYHGLMMQLLTYLDTAVEHSEELFGRKAKPAGAFYAQVKNPLLDGRSVKDKNWLEEMLKEFKMKGILLNEDDLLSSIDKTLDNGVSSLVYPLKKLVKGQLRGSFITLDDLELLLRHHRTKIREAGNLILSGENQLAPFYEKKGHTPTTVGGVYHPISQFDVLLPDNQNYYRNLPKIKDQNELIDKLKVKYQIIEPGKEDDAG
ncbi:DNA helicase/exodeoxyribonuclease V, subunit B [Alkalibacterium subtropicum]|uniref:DNA helicase/exodeoxyribonuclease V, subunit B n=1 Tax=Alkalibacterium subtropicum TaxID=753702 RepID=A0A1I1JVW8_9LACT|nr:PD-(D/E)XK nuclease family protein [Alkalibacterium subtropicum]SFC52515.1 DNA helicase/exodeoxyribonuclease V, subunit B [Alkalibacterium subtropicum]